MGAHPPQKREEVLELVRAGVTRNDIVRQTGVSAGTVHKWAKDAGLSFDRTDTKAATQARQADLADRRAQAQDVELQILEASQTAILATLNGTGRWKSLVRDEDGAEVTAELSFVPSVDFQRHANARSMSTTIIGRLSDGDAGEAHAKSLILGIAAGLGLHSETAD